VALAMFRQLVDPTRFDVELTSAEVLTSEVVALVETTQPAVICLSLLPPGGLVHARYLCKRLRARYPDVKILVGRWGTARTEGRKSGTSCAPPAPITSAQACWRPAITSRRSRRCSVPRPSLRPPDLPWR
jgi:hypothetical protein